MNFNFHEVILKDLSVGEMIICLKILKILHEESHLVKGLMIGNPLWFNFRIRHLAVCVPHVPFFQILHAYFLFL